MNLVHNEQIKLTATALNNVAVAFVVVGFVAPVTAVVGRDSGGFTASIPLSLIWLATGVVLHLGARLVLRSFKP